MAPFNKIRFVNLSEMAQGEAFIACCAEEGHFTFGDTAMALIPYSDLKSVVDNFLPGEFDDLLKEALEIIESDPDLPHNDRITFFNLG